MQTEIKSDELERFNLFFPGTWITGPDRNKAIETQLTLEHIEAAFIEAVTAFSLFKPITDVTAMEDLKIQKSRYECCLNTLYAKAFVYSLDAIEKLLCVLGRAPNAPAAIQGLLQEYGKYFGHLKHIRDSAIHVEDRGRCRTRKQARIKSNLLILGGFIGAPVANRFSYTGENGRTYEVEFSDATLLCAHKIL